MSQEDNEGNLPLVLSFDDGYAKVNGSDDYLVHGQSSAVEGELVLSYVPTTEFSLKISINGYSQLAYSSTGVNGNRSTTFYACPDDSYTVKISGSCSNAIPFVIVHVPTTTPSAFVSPSPSVLTSSKLTSDSSAIITKNTTTSEPTTAGSTAVTVEQTIFTTYCPSPTTFAYQGSTYTVSETTTLTLTDCGCTKETSATSSSSSSASSSSLPIADTSAPAVANGAVSQWLSGLAVAAAVAVYLI